MIYMILYDLWYDTSVIMWIMCGEIYNSKLMHETYVHIMNNINYIYLHGFSDPGITVLEAENILSAY